MTNFKVLLAISLFFIGFLGANAQNSDFQYIKKSKEIIRYFVEAKYDSIYAKFDANMKEQIKKEYLPMIWEQIEEKYGKFEVIKASQLLPNDKMWMVDIAVGFVNQDVSTKITYDSTNQIAGLFFNPMNSKSSYYKIPSYADTSKIAEKDLKFGEQGWELEGTLTLPKYLAGKPIVVILVPGAGSHDRDLTIGNNKVFKDIAWGLASKGIASLRYDKRTYKYKNKMSKVLDPDFDDIIVDDIIEAINMLAESDLVNNKNIYVAGHALGGYLLPKVAERTDKIAGLIFMSAVGRNLTYVLEDQYDYLSNLDGKIDENEQKFLDRLDKKIQNARNISKYDKVLPKYLPMGLTASFWKYLDNYDLQAYTDKINVPMLFLRGTHDYQVTEKDWKVWMDLFGKKKGRTFAELEGLNHLYHKSPKKPTPEDYQKTGHVDKSFLDIVLYWLNNN